MERRTDDRGGPDTAGGAGAVRGAAAGGSEGAGPLPPQSLILEAAERLRVLTDAGEALSASLDAAESLERLARMLIPRFADGCVADLLDGNRVHRVVVAHRDAETARRVTAASAAQAQDVRSELDDSAAPLGRVLRGAAATAVTDLTDSAHSPDAPGAFAAAQRDAFRALGAGTVLTVAMRARGRVLGALSLVRHGRFGAEDRALAVEIGHRAALAVDNARLYGMQRSTAEQLQRSLLPDLAQLGELPLAARYVPARESAEVGGDWYDAFPLPDGSAVLAIGDVMGHDLTAAVRMSQLRNMLRALAYDSGRSPAELTRRLDRVMQGLSSIELVTAVVARLRLPEDGGPWRVQWTNAGHPPPLLTAADGSTRLLEGALAPVLGVDPELAREDAEVELTPGTTLLLYTDGLVERPGEDIDRGLTRLRRHASALAREPLQRFCDTLVEELASASHDDVALLALRAL